MRTAAVILVKARCEAKTRLAHVLDAGRRRIVVERWLEGVVAAVRGSAAVARIWVVSPERPALPPGVEHVADGGIGQNLAAALGLAAAAASDVDAVLVLGADLPGLSPDDVDAMIAALTDADIAIAPDHLGIGTNALALRLPTRFRSMFGPDSLVRHCRQADDLGLRTRIVDRAGLARDVDTPADLAAIAEHRTA